MSWWKISYTPRRTRTNATLLRMVENMLSTDGDITAQSARWKAVPVLVEACERAGRSYTLRGVAVDGIIAGYEFSTRPEDQKSGAQISAGLIDGNAYVMMSRDEIIADSQEHRGGLMEVSNVLYASCHGLGIDIPLTEGGDAEQTGADFATAIAEMAAQLIHAREIIRQNGLAE